eukprot:sb/3468510/
MWTRISFRFISTSAPIGCASRRPFDNPPGFAVWFFSPLSTSITRLPWQLNCSRSVNNSFRALIPLNERLTNDHFDVHLQLIIEIISAHSFGHIDACVRSTSRTTVLDRHIHIISRSENRLQWSQAGIHHGMIVSAVGIAKVRHVLLLACPQCRGNCVTKSLEEFRLTRENEAGVAGIEVTVAPTLFRVHQHDPTEIIRQPIRTRHLGHVSGYQPIRDQYSLIRSVAGTQFSIHARGSYYARRPQFQLFMPMEKHTLV